MSDDSLTRVLLVEDDEDDAILVQDYLDESEPPCTVTLVESLADAVERMHRPDATFDIVLLDLSLPDSRGLDTLTGVLDSGHDLPVIVLTGLDDRDLAARAVRRGAQEYLVKGEFDGPSLRRTIRHAVQRWRRLHEVAASRADDHARALNARMQADVAAMAPEGATAHTPALVRAGDSELDLLVVRYADVVAAYVDAVRGKRVKPTGSLQEVAVRLAAMRVPASYAVHMHLRALGQLEASDDPVFARESKLTLLALLGELADAYLTAVADHQRGATR